MLHLPLLRGGKPYYSLETEVLTDVRDQQPVVAVSQALPGLIARDLARSTARQQLAEHSVCELLTLCAKAADLFAHAELPLGETVQSPADYLRQLAATTGMPEVMGAANLGKIVKMLREMPAVLDGLTRGLDLTILDQGWGVQQQRRLSYQCQTDSLGAILPNNSPGVHSLWLPALPLKVPLVLKPGRTEPWTPFRLAQALLAAGCPPAAVSVYPTTHSGGVEILLRCGRSLFFGDAKSVAAWQGSGKVQVHGPGWSKVLLSAEEAARFPAHLDLLVGSIAANGGRSCINASGVWTPLHGRELALALAERLAAIPARPLQDPTAQLAAFADPEVARRISQLIDQQLLIPGAEDLTAEFRGQERVVQCDGCTFLLPTLIYCTDPAHPLAHSEFVFPFAAVVEVAADQLMSRIGSTLVATAIGDDPAFVRQALDCRSIDRLNLGPIPTYHIAWDQPHEGNLFEHLYTQRAFQAIAS